MSLEYTTAKGRKKPVVFSLDGREFTFTPKKMAKHVLSALDGEDAGAILDWFANGLSKEDEEFISQRLEDENDELDIDVIMEIVEGLIGRLVGRPTKSRSGLRRSR